VLFRRLGCGFCHGGIDTTDSAGGKLHDVGTLAASSGYRHGGPLDGLDTPTLNGVWQTAPYLHDGSAATLGEVLTSRNTRELHGATSVANAAQLGQLESYLLQIDGTIDQEPPTAPVVETAPELVEPNMAADSNAGCTIASRSEHRWEVLLAASLAAFSARRRRT
jgi:cytochrome c peroxidase